MGNWNKVEDIFVDWNDPYLKKLFNQARSTEKYFCPFCNGFLQNCLMNDEGFHSFSEIFYCNNEHLFFTSQTFIAKSFIVVDEKVFSDCINQDECL